MISIKTSTGALERYIAQLQKLDKAELERQCAELIVKEIKEQTGKHLDVNGHLFKPYTPKYKRVRERKSLPTVPDLKVTGTLLDALTVTKQGTITTITDTDNPGKVEGVNQKRTFIGISTQTREKLRSLVRTFVGLKS